MAALERLVAGYCRQAAALAGQVGDDATLPLYLTQADPMEVLRDLLGHFSILVTEVYLRRLDTTRVFREAAAHAGHEAGISRATQAEVEAEFLGEDDLDELMAIS